MAFQTIPRSVSSNGKAELSMDQFKKWLKRFDKNGDGKISVEELQEAIRANGGGWFSKWKAKRIMKSVDTNSNGVIDDKEISKLVAFAQSHFNLKVVAYHS